jgi:enoyl-CoA hydratase/carnithine racemase
MTQILDSNIQFDGATQLLPRIIGLNKAKEMIMFGVGINSEEAISFGLVNIVTNEYKLMNLMIEKLLKIVSFSPLAIQYTKEAINFGNETPTVEGMKMENDLSSILLSSKDRIQAINSFKNKKSRRKFKGK